VGVRSNKIDEKRNGPFGARFAVGVREQHT
jgi:hypothetical protein